MITVTARSGDFDELSGDEPTAFGVRDLCPGHFDAETQFCQDCDDIFKISCGSWFFENVKCDYERNEQHFGLTLIACSFRGKKSDVAVKRDLALFCAIVAVSVSSRWEPR